MKKLLFLIVIIFLFSCEKQGPGCWQCKTEQITQYTIDLDKKKNRLYATVIPGDTTWIDPVYTDWLQDFRLNPSIQEYCDKTPDEIATIEKMGTFVHNLFGIWWNQTTTCKLK